MVLASEYQKQFAWRDWKTALDLCPISKGQRVLDLGCGPGDLSRELSARGAHVIGIDTNSELIEVARSNNPGLDFRVQDLRALDLEPESFDGLWCSFTAAYFTDFESVFQIWTRFLKPSAWVCLVEMDDLLGHEPMQSELRKRIEDFYDASFAHGRHDFRAGRKMSDILKRAGFTAESRELRDDELSFSGAATPEVLQAWSARLDRMRGIQNHFSGEAADFKAAFLESIARKDHESRCRVICAIGKRTQ